MRKFSFWGWISFIGQTISKVLYNCYSSTKNRRVFNNFLVVLTLAKDVYDYDQIIESLFPIMELKELIMRDEINSLSDFISRKGKYISNRLLSKLIKFAVENNQLYEYEIFHSLSQQVIKNQKKILITNRNLFELIKNNFLGTCTLCDHLHSEILMHLTPLLI